jgi:hypothetical protein
LELIMNDQTTLAALQARDARHHFHPNTDMAALNLEGTRVIVRGEGVWLHDAAGRKILDGFSGLWNVAVGYGRREIADAAYKQMVELPFYNTFFKSTTIPAIDRHRTGGNPRRPGPGVFQGVLHQFRLRGQRHHHPPGAALLEAARPAEEIHLHRAP